MITALLLSFIVWGGGTHTSGCDASTSWQSCTVENKGGSVDVGASVGSSGVAPNRPAPGAPPAPAPPPAACLEDSRFEVSCGYEVAMLPTVFAEDLVSFRPAAPSIVTEPAGLGVAGLPANVVATASEHRLAGDLLGYAVTVRFVPVGFTFDYGDGRTHSATHGGGTWAQLGQAPFTPTPTSHAYWQRGDYVIAVRVRYAASVDFGTGAWRPVVGEVTASAAASTIRIFEARTALVDATCAEQPRGTGC